jgi:hypothetical protein
MIPMHKTTAIALLAALLSCAAFSQSHPARYGWKERPSEKFALSYGAKRKLPLVIPAVAGSDTAMVNVQLTSQFPVTMAVQNARGDRLGNCHYADVTQLAANCSLRRDSKPKYIVVEDVNQAVLTEGTKGPDALNHVTLTISDYGCEKNCPTLP